MSSLEALSAALGIVPGYHDLPGEWRPTTDETRRAIIAAMGIDASTESRVAEAQRALEAWERDRLLDPVAVVEEAAFASETHGYDLRIRLPANGVEARGGRWKLSITTENGAEFFRDGRWVGGLEIDLHGFQLPLGYHSLQLEVSEAGTEYRGEQRLIVVPSRCWTPDEVLGNRRAFGLTANLYAVRSERNWGIGDVTDLSDLAEWAGSIGASFVGINPLHALLNRGIDVSPYSPVSRLFRNPIYTDIDEIPERWEGGPIAERLASAELCDELRSLRESREVRYGPVMATKGLVLDALHKVFARSVRGSGSARDREYATYVAEHEPELTRFATWMALFEGRGQTEGGRESDDWHAWSREFREPDSVAVARFQEEHRDRIDFHKWAQFELDRQIGLTARRGRASGLRIGLYQDLAIGSSGSGADAWAFPHLFARGASVGAPPDPYAPQGQNWGFPPIDPRALREDRYRYFIRLIRTGFRHAGALRIDHVMGLFRLFWIPDGMTGAQGTYVRYPHHDLLGILALESRRQHAIVVGEDLGTVPADVPPTLSKWGILSSKVFFFEQHWGKFKGHDEYPANALATANTHDMVPLAGYDIGRDIELRRQVGLLDDHGVDEARHQRERERRAITERLREASLTVPPPTYADVYSGPHLRAAVHEFVCRTPSVLAGIALDDLSGETEPVNMPGVTPDVFPCWSRKMRLTLTELMHSDEVRALLPCADRAIAPDPDGAAREMRNEEPDA